MASVNAYFEGIWKILRILLDKMAEREGLYPSLPVTA